MHKGWSPARRRGAAQSLLPFPQGEAFWAPEPQTPQSRKAAKPRVGEDLHVQVALDCDSLEGQADKIRTEKTQGHCGDRMKVTGKGGAACVRLTQASHALTHGLCRLFNFSRAQSPNGRDRA